MSITVIEAGRKGGLTVLHKKGRQFFSEIGRKGQQAMRAKYPSMASAWGKLGGRPKKSTLYLPGGGVVKQKKEDVDPPFIHPSPSATISLLG